MHPVDITEKNNYQRSFYVEGGNFTYAGIVSTSIKSILKKMDLPVDLVRKSAIVSYESEINIVSYAKKGVIKLTIDSRTIQIEAIDEGPGIPDIELAMQAGYSTADQRIREMGFGAGMGLSNIKRYADVFDLTSEVGKGTYLKMIINRI
ncbi:MAG: Serine/threonine-protein kinase RsbT [Actinobacteria bacterium ADurb.Bin346]|nr:MAG: Serine/threonine-protein kinase RsbT [Actinobacteria bacterium ADurb.Bin346]